MEANIKENQITFSKGMSNVPSDNLCDDNCLSDCVGLRMKDGELKAVQSPASLVENLGGTLMYVHKTATYTHLIYSNNGSLYWRDKSGAKSAEVGISSITDDTTVTSIGNTLIVTTGEGLDYAVWRDDQYKVISSLPEVTVEIKGGDTEMLSMRPADKTLEEQRTSYEILNSAVTESISRDDTAKNEMIGVMEGCYKNACRQGYFTFPFWIRAALKFYDGSYAMISPPVLAFPTVRNAAFVRLSRYNTNKTGWKVDAAYGNCCVRMSVKLNVEGSFEGLNDIVDKVVLFMSDQVKTWSETDPNETEKISEATTRFWDRVDSDGNYKKMDKLAWHIGGRYYASWGYVETEETSESTSKYKYTYLAPPYSLTDEEIIEKLLDTSVFYKIAELTPDSPAFSRYASMESLMKRGVLENLTTQEQLEHDDYYGHCKYKAKFMYAFNNRLQIANIERQPWNGKYHLTSYEESDYGLVGTVKIEGASGTMYANVTTYVKVNDVPVFFFYPDPRATEVTFDDGKGMYKLKAHPRLNGAYYFQTLPPDMPTQDGSGDTSAAGGTEVLNTRVMTSEVNNPWVFNAEGDNTVGTGEIVGMVSNTRALSQGQFGQHPLIVFTSEGIYALGTNSEGLYSTNYPLSREVCNNPKSITPTDGAVFFTSEKGLMMMVGSEITCVSQQMMGKTDVYSPDSLYSQDSQDSQDSQGGGHGYSKEAVNFHDFLKDCIIAYDYRDYCLYIINSSYGYHYVYDIKSGAITRQDVSTEKYQRVVNDYPDNLLQDSNQKVWSLIAKPEANADETAYKGMLLSRPIKFADAQTLKSLRQVLHVMDLHDGAGVTLHIYVSNELKHWGEIKSLKGCGWKYFRFGLAFSKLNATDSYSGLIAITQNRRTDKLR